MITLEKVVEAYEKTGITPIHGTFAKIKDGKKCGCVITALAVNTGKVTYEKMDDFFNGSGGDDFNYLYYLLGINKDEFNLVKFYDGFDQNGFNKDSLEYKIGSDIREGLKSKGMID